jgi:HAMP domain-containing protein
MDTHTVISRAAVVSSPADLAVLLRGLRQRHARSRRAPVLSYRELAARTGWSHGIIGAYLTGKVLPPVDRLDELGRQLGAAPAELGALATARERVADRRSCPPSGPPRQLPAAVPGFTGRTGMLTTLDAAGDPGDPGAPEPAGRARNAGGAVTGGPVVLSGPAGVGKTALAVHWAHRSAAAFPDGQLWADLRGSGPHPTDPAVVLDRFVLALGGAAGGGETAYRTLLAHRRVLVVLDDVASPDQVRPLLPGGPGCRVVITSRARLTALVAIDGAQPLLVDPLDRQEARRLLAARLGPDRVAADPDGSEALCAASAGLPLALAVAAARVLTRPGIELLTVARELAAGDLPADGDWNRVTEIDRLSAGRGG